MLYLFFKQDTTMNTNHATNLLVKPSTSLQVGDLAPLFSGVDQHGNKIELTSFKGQKIVLYFYPKDNTPGCTAQTCNLRDNQQELKDQNCAIIGVSADSVLSHKKFTDKYNLPFPLIADTDKQIVQQYGVWGEKKFMGKSYQGIHRRTFIIDEQQYIIGIIDRPKTKDHASEVLPFLLK